MSDVKADAERYLHHVRHRYRPDLNYDDLPEPQAAAARCCEYILSAATTLDAEKFKELESLMPIEMVPLSDGSWQSASNHRRIESVNRIKDFIERNFLRSPERDAEIRRSCKEKDREIERLKEECNFLQRTINQLRSDEAALLAKAKEPKS